MTTPWHWDSADRRCPGVAAVGPSSSELSSSLLAPEPSASDSTPARLKRGVPGACSAPFAADAATAAGAFAAA
eukprot:332933-Pyramimonas_sp.AAC.1